MTPPRRAPAPRMKVGLNIQRFLGSDYGLEFGLPPVRNGRRLGLPSWCSGGRYSQGFRLMQLCTSRGIRVLRWWILCDGEVLEPQPVQTSTPRYVERYDPDHRRQNVWAVGPPKPLNPAVLQDFEQLLRFAVQANVLLMPCLLSYGLAVNHPGNRYTRRRSPLTGGPTAQCMRYDWIRYPGYRVMFVERVIRPLVRLAARPEYRRNIYAIDPMNEPEWPAYFGWVDSAEMSDFLRLVFREIHAVGLPSTISFAKEESLAEYDWWGWNVTIPQYHVYAGSGPQYVHHQRPTCIGEMSMVPDVPGWSWSGQRWSRTRSRSLGHRLAQLNELGFDSAFLWRYKAPRDVIAREEKDAEGWERPSTLVEVARYAAGGVRP